VQAENFELYANYTRIIFINITSSDHFLYKNTFMLGDWNLRSWVQQVDVLPAQPNRHPLDNVKVVHKLTCRDFRLSQFIDTVDCKPTAIFEI
jgi:hypothetical protein